MKTQISDDNIRTLLTLAEQQRMHWSTMINTILGFVIVANVGIWTYALSNYFRSLSSQPLIMPQPSYIWIGTAASAISLGLWRLYTRYLDNKIAAIYPDIIYYESQLFGNPLDRFNGLHGYLLREVFSKIDCHLLLRLYIELPAYRKSNAIRRLAEIKRIGDRGHKNFDLATLSIIILLLIPCSLLSLMYAYGNNRLSQIIWYLQRNVLFILFYIGCSALIIIGILLVVLALTRYQRTPNNTHIASVVK